MWKILIAPYERHLARSGARQKGRAGRHPRGAADDLAPDGDARRLVGVLTRVRPAVNSL
jgi:hypothetical protein